MVIQPAFLDKLQAFRTEIGKPFIINFGESRLRGWRSWKENSRIDGKLYHPQGLAADITVEGMSILELARAAKKFGFTGIGMYDTWVHVDMRPMLDDRIVVWDYRSNKEEAL